MNLPTRLRALRRAMTPRLAWDLLMVYLAVLNLGLILFDLTYLWLRPFYYSRLPVVTRVYDDVKGIEPHPVTGRYAVLVEELSEIVEAGPTTTELNRRRGEIEPRLAELRQISEQMLEENPFERSGQTKRLRGLRAGLVSHLRSEGFRPASVRESFEILWSWDPERLPERIEFLNREVLPHLSVNFHRRHGLDGELVDWFWAIDLPFLLVFATEFFSRWIVAVRRRTYAKWFFFPILNWYDLLGIIPVRQFRFFRLFRIASIYVRLYRSDQTRVGDDFISRTVKYFANIITEEISDMVALRILGETADELRRGAHKRIIREAVAPHREALAREITLRMQALLSSAEVRDQARGFLDANLERAAESARALQRLPLPERVVRPLVVVIGHAVFDSIAETMTATLESEEGSEVLQSILVDALDGLVDGLTEGELEAIAREISLEVIREISETVSVRKWMEVEEPAPLPPS